MSNLLSYKFWLNLRPGSLLAIYQNIFIGFVAILIIAFFVFWILKSKKQGLYIQIWNRLFSFSLGNAIIGLVLLFFNYELIPFLSARFWFLLWGAGMIVWLVFILKALIKIPDRKKQIEKDKEFRKYIP